tara:strand:- start:744 stop:923 length:180 start_codon:yes stop_codon:yes gene_type:complete
MFSSSADPDAPEKCPFCKKDIGAVDNTYRFSAIDLDTGGGQVMSISCANCRKILGFVNA